jgi:hypothetical protein
MTVPLGHTSSGDGADNGGGHTLFEKLAWTLSLFLSPTHTLHVCVPFWVSQSLYVRVLNPHRSLSLLPHAVPVRPTSAAVPILQRRILGCSPAQRFKASEQVWDRVRGTNVQCSEGRGVVRDKIQGEGTKQVNGSVLFFAAAAAAKLFPRLHTQQSQCRTF